MVASTGRYTDSSSDTIHRIDAEEEIQELLHALDDADCRKILDATSDEILSANEVSEMCSLPLSTTYRKLDMLTDTGLLAERTRIRRSGKHASEYSRLVEDVVISVSTCGEMKLQVSHCENAERIESFGTVGGE